MLSTRAVILNWNGEQMLRRFLPGVVASLPEWAGAVVVDNGSTDGSCAFVEREFPGVQLLRLERNYGFAEGYNRALAQLDGEVFVLLNSDVETPKGWLEPLVECLERHPETAVAAPKLLSFDERGRFEYAGAAGGYIDFLGYPFCRGRILGSVECDRGQYDDGREVFWASGAAFCCRAAAFREAGGFDGDFFAHMEEIDLCWRVRLMGYRIVTVTETAVYHLGGGSLPVENPKKTYLNFRNNLLMLYKNLPAESRGRLLLRRRLLDTVAWAKFVITLDWRNAAAVFRAHRDYAAMKSKYGDMPAPGRNLLASDPMGKVNILIEYYLRGHRKFSAIFARDKHF